MGEGVSKTAKRIPTSFMDGPLESLRLDLRCAAVSYQRPPVMDRGLARFLASPKTTHLSTVNPPPPLIFALPNCSYITYVE